MEDERIPEIDAVTDERGLSGPEAHAVCRVAGGFRPEVLYHR
jgi:hypothetical protein